ncbi:Beta-ketoacyl-acyl-carrier-protein synthase I [Mycobacterium basiliense]|uniref:Beta-ketoacyl-acyl-carrier-protein synthase I n=1 Tax=Mycobacterium basiliense TaxID=2094119 RepID=A0A3S4BE02_9MYCO|nr:type I polyketide synthase [Mycobacterium basiliense]VDM88574.1 Beta-ketoacyl-acyl-carrier-protein synthase I [Mycobacterium basiliense]
MSDKAAIRSLVLEVLAEHTNMMPTDIDEFEPFSSYGLGSVAAAAVAGELANRLGMKIDPLALFEYPCVATLVDGLTASSSGPGRRKTTAVSSRSTHEAIAITGMACRMPGAPSTDMFWQRLLDGADAISAVPQDRWPADESTGLSGGFVDGVDLFDNHFFRVSAAEAARMDPQQRLLLEVSWHALEDAGVVPDRLKANPVGVFVGASFSDYGMTQLAASVNGHALTNTGCALALLANRLSYFYDLRGPSMTVDTACSSALVATHLAARAIRAGDCEQALVGAVNLLLTPQISRGLVAAGMLAPDGRCKPFDARANGYVRAEGCGVLVLKPLDKARRDKDRIYAVIRGSAVGQDGLTNGLTAPNPLAQRAVLSAAYADAGVSPKDVGYIECHGIGTPLGDRIEATALGSVIGTGSGRDAEQPCLIGSVKSNIGHLESAAGIAGLIKAALVLHTGVVPSNINYTEPNPTIPFEKLGLRVAAENVQLPSDGVALAGVSAFGFGGTDAHVVLESVKAITGQEPTTATAPTRYAVLPVSACTQAALAATRAEWADALDGAGEGGMVELVRVAALRRTHHPLRLAVAGSSSQELATALRNGGARIQTLNGAPKPLFVFAGHEAQSVDLLRGLAAEESLVASVLARCDEALAECADWSLRELAATTDPRLFADTAFVQPALCATQIALNALWRSMGVQPGAVLGHGVGEIAAAEAAGILDIPTAMRLSYERGRLTAPLHGHGRMLAIGLPEADTAALAERHGVDVAAINSPDTTVLSGAADRLEEIAKTVSTRGTFVRWLNGHYPFHSSLVQPAAEQLVAVLSGLESREGAVPFVSGTGGAVQDGRSLDATYWGHNLRHTVRFAAALHIAVELGADTVLEVGARPVLHAAIRRTVQSLDHQGPVVLPAKRVRHDDELRSTYETVADLYSRGCNIRWRHKSTPVVEPGRFRVSPPRARVVQAPRYPFDPARHWLRPPPVTVGTGRSAGPLVGAEIDLSNSDGRRVWEVWLSLDSLPHLGGYRVAGAAVLPASAVIEGVVVLATVIGIPDADVVDVVIYEPLLLGVEPIAVQWTVVPGDLGEFAVTMHARRDCSWRLQASASLRPPVDAALAPVSDRAAGARSRCDEQLSPRQVYQMLARHGSDYAPELRGVRQVWRRADEAVARISVDNGDFTRLLDSAFHVVAAAAGMPPTNHGPRPFLPVSAEFVRHAPSARLLGEVDVTVALRNGDADEIVCDLTLFDTNGVPILLVGGLSLQAHGAQPSLPQCDATTAVTAVGAGLRSRPDIGEYVAPRNELEQRIATIWATALGVDRLSVFDGFFELGGDSVFANQILIEINRMLGVRIEPERAFRALTVAGLAELAEQEMLSLLANMTDDEAAALAGWEE